MANKGGPFERLLATALSLWWSKGKRDDLAWRTAGSGARATVRGRKGKRTAGHVGDLGATNDRMIPFFKLVTIEAKRGYNKTTSLHNLFDPPTRQSKKDKATNYTAFIQQAQQAAKRARTPYWILVHRPDRKNAVVFMPMELAENLMPNGNRVPAPWGLFVINKTPMMFTALSNFFNVVTRKDFKRLYAQLSKTKKLSKA